MQNTWQYIHDQHGEIHDLHPIKYTLYTKQEINGLNKNAGFYASSQWCVCVEICCVWIKICRGIITYESILNDICIGWFGGLLKNVTFFYTEPQKFASSSVIYLQSSQSWKSGFHSMCDTREFPRAMAGDGLQHVPLCHALRYPTASHELLLHPHPCRDQQTGAQK